jgi:hypothetical protein
MTWVINLRGLIILIYLIKYFTYEEGDKIIMKGIEDKIKEEIR